MFILGRAIAGCGAAGVLNGAFTIIAASAPLDKRPGMKTRFALTDGFLIFPLVLMGTLIGIASVGIISGPLIGGGLTQHVSWRWCSGPSNPLLRPSSLDI
jgi:MFS family permease